jgi:sodium/hydrogen antiporter
MGEYILLITLFGTVVLLTTWLPTVLKDMPLSLPIVCIVLGAIVAFLPLSSVPSVNPLVSRVATERITEFVLIISLMGAGLKLDRPIGWRSWAITWRLLGISMPLTIAAIAALGWGFLGLSLASAILLGAALAPTDPVLASDVQVGPPNTAEEDDVRFALTSEAGLNDGLSFPFVHLAIAVAIYQGGGDTLLQNWLLVSVVWKLSAAVVVGWITGKLLGYIAFRLPHSARLAGTGDGLAAIGITCLCYGLTEIVHGYGFLAVFVAAVTLRAAERQHHFHEQLHAFTEQIERLLMMVVLVCFGAAIADGSIFGALSWEAIVIGLVILLVVRPLSGIVGLAGTRMRRGEKLVIAFFGIRGLGSFYYVAYAVGVATFQTEILWTVVCFVVLVSIVMHGVVVKPTMRALDRQTEDLAALSSGATVMPTTPVSPSNGKLAPELDRAASENAAQARQ